MNVILLNVIIVDGILLSVILLSIVLIDDILINVFLLNAIMLNVFPLNVILLNATMPNVKHSSLKSMQWQSPPPALTHFHFWLQRIFWQESKADADADAEADADEVASNVDPQKNNSFEAFEKFDTFHFEGNEPWRGQIKKALALKLLFCWHLL